MASKKPRKKKYRPEKYDALLTKHLIRDKDAVLVFNMTDKTNAYQWINLAKGTVITPSPDLHEVVIHRPQRWSIYQAVACETQAGERYLKSHELHPRVSYLYRTLVEFSYEQILDLVKGSNEGHRRGVYQFASPVHREFDEKHIFNLLESMGAYDR